MSKLSNFDIYLFRSMLASYITQSNRMIKIQAKIQDIMPLLNAKDIQNNGMILKYKDFKLGVDSLFARLDYLVKELNLEIDNVIVNPLITSTRNQLLIINERETKEIKLTKHAVYLYRYLCLQQILVYSEYKANMPLNVWEAGEVQDNASLTKLTPEAYLELMKLKFTELEAYCSEKGMLHLDKETRIDLLINRLNF